MKQANTPVVPIHMNHMKSSKVFTLAITILGLSLDVVSAQTTTNGTVYEVVANYYAAHKPDTLRTTTTTLYWNYGNYGDPLISGIIADTNGFLYTAVYETSSDNNYLVKTTFTNSIAWVSGLDYASAMTFDASGILYYAGSGGQIIKIDASAHITPFITLPSAAVGLAFDRTSGNFFAIMGANVVRITPQGQVSPFATLQAPGSALAADSRGNLYTETSAGVERVTPDGTDSIYFPLTGQSFYSPYGWETVNHPLWGLCIDQSDNMYYCFEYTSYPMAHQRQITGVACLSTNEGFGRIYDPLTSFFSADPVAPLAYSPLGPVPSVDLYNGFPLVTTQPLSLTVTSGSSASFSVTVSSQTPFGCQWQLNGVNLSDGGNISDSQSNTLTLATTCLSDAGSYTVIVTNAFGSVTSFAATLTVMLAPSITTQPQSQTILAGSNVLFNLAVAAYPAVSYHWAFNGTNLAGKTDSSLLLTNVQFKQRGAYTVAVTNSMGYAISTQATLTVLSPPLLSSPASQLGYWGKSVTFTVGVAGTEPFFFQWQKDGVPIAGETNETLILTNLPMTAEGGYTVVVTNQYGIATSAPAYLTMNPAGVSIALYAGVTIDGVVGLTYGVQWNSNLSNTNGWQGIANVTLDTPTELWLDLRPATQPQRYYRVVPGPISVP
jgi:hypothetical protein